MFGLHRMSGREKSKSSPATSPMGRDNKHGWYEEHEKFVAIATRSLSSVLLVGDSMVKGLARYHRVWSKYFEPLRALNFGVGGDRTQHVLWRIDNGEIPLNLQVAFVHCGTNNLDRDNPAEIRDGIASIVYTIQEKKPNANIIVSGLLPRDQEISSRRDKIKLVNQKLMKWCRSGKVRNVHYLKPDKDWTNPDGRLVERYYFSDFLHLVEEGYEKFAKSIYEAIVKVSQGNAVNLVKDHKRPRSKSGSTTPPKTQQKQNGQKTSMTFTTTVLPKPKLTATLPPPTAIALKLKIPPTVTSTLIPTIPPIATSPTATLPPAAALPPTTSLTPKLTPTSILPPKLTRTKTLPPKVTPTTTLPPTATIPSTTTLTPELTPTAGLSPTLTPTATLPPKITPTTTLPPFQTPAETLLTKPDQTATLPTATSTTTFSPGTKPKQTQSLPPKLGTFLLLLVVLFLNKNFAFNSELLDTEDNNLDFRRNKCNTVFNNTFLNFINFNNNVDTKILQILVLGMAYTLDDSFPSNNATQSLNLKNVLHKPVPVFYMNIKAFFPVFFLFLLTLGKWLTKTFSPCHISIKFKYLFLKSRKRFRKQHMCLILQKVFLFLLVAFTFDGKVPSKTQHDINSVENKDHELFTNQYFAVADMIRSNCLKEQFSLYALSKLDFSKLKFSKHYWYFKYLLILSGDINLHPGPVQYPCSVCAKPVKKRLISCEKCGLWIHKRCNQFEKPRIGSLLTCRPCQNKPIDHLDNIWHQFTFADDFFEDRDAPSDEQTNINFGTSSSIDNWKVFNKRGLHLIHLNINSLLSKIDELRAIAKKSRAAVIGITESKLDESVTDGEINIDGYEVIRSDRNRHGGGVACYIRNDISFNPRGNFSSEVENIFLEMLLPKTKPILIGILYRPPDQSKFLDKLSTAISETDNFDAQEVYILGDLNINLINNQKHTPNNGIKRYKEFCSLNGLKQLLTLPTRITKTSTSLLDHVLTNSADRVSQFGVVDTGLSDHQLIYCTRKITRTKTNVHKYIKTRSLKNYSQTLFLDKLRKVNFPDYSNFKDINNAYSDFTEKVTSVIDEIAPIKEIRVKNNSQDWFDAEINEEIERRDKSLAKFKKSRLHSDNESYKKARNKVQRMIKDKKKNFFTGKLNENIGKPKELWKSLKSLGLPSKKSSCSTICLEKDGILSFDPKANAEIFKDFYSNLANDLVKKLPNPPNKYGKDAVKKYYENLNLVGKSFSFEPVAYTSVLKLLQQLNPHKSAGIDNLTGKFLKEGGPVLASPITNLINLSISLSSFPDDCKIAKLKPLYKKEAKTKPKNYRPISLLPLISKIIERIIHDQTQVFLDENKILFTYQSGFRKHYSTDTCLSYLTDRVRNGFEKGSLTGMILIDLQKAFDTIDHKILTEKMSCLGFAESTIRWYKSYLTNRCFIVNVGNDFSSPGKLLCGVPQGSILGPLLFLLYVNDMPQAVNSDLLLYADDTCLIYTGKDINTIEEQLNTDFSSLCDWFVDNKLSVHFGEEKTKSILFGTKRQLKNQRDLDLRYGDLKIKQHSKVTYLGCILDNDLSGESMAAKVLRLVNNRLKFLYRKQKFLTLSLRRLLCNALIQPHYDYACSAWYPSLNKRLSKKIQTSQNKCIRYCLNPDNRAHVGIDEFIKINWLPTKERVAQCICVNIFKFFNKMSPQYMSEIFHPSHSRYNTRMATLKLDLPFRQSCPGQKTISYLGPNIWNNLAAETKLRRSVNSFKHDIKKLFFDKLKKQNDDIFFYY